MAKGRDEWPVIVNKFVNIWFPPVISVLDKHGSSVGNMPWDRFSLANINSLVHRTNSIAYHVGYVILLNDKVVKQHT